MKTSKTALGQLPAGTLGEIIEMALSDHVGFDQLRALHGLGPNEVKALMKQALQRGSYVNWRKRVRDVSERRNKKMLIG